jgi:hypothetical protein
MSSLVAPLPTHESPVVAAQFTCIPLSVFRIQRTATVDLYCKLDDSRHACLTKDLSRKGLGFYAPVNFLPRKTVLVWLPNGEKLSVRVTRCRRLGEHCYEAGASFDANK